MQRLKSISMSLRWRDGENTSYCEYEGTPICDDPKHHCGLWAFHRDSTYHGVQGVVEGYGTVDVGSLGWRASHARILALTPACLPSPICKYASQTSIGLLRALAEAYPSAQVFATYEEMVEAYPVDPSAPPPPEPSKIPPSHDWFGSPGVSITVPVNMMAWTTAEVAASFRKIANTIPSFPAQWVRPSTSSEVDAIETRPPKRAATQDHHPKGTHWGGKQDHGRSPFEPKGKRRG